MATRIQSGKHIARQINIEGITSPVIVTMDNVGLSIRGVGKRKTVTITWERLVAHADVPGNAPSKFHDFPEKFLNS